MITLRQVRDLQLAALKDARPCYRNVLEASRALGNCVLSRCIQRRDKTAAKLRNFGEGVRLAALVDDAENRPVLDIG